jgi:hypothetical protein
MIDCIFNNNLIEDLPIRLFWPFNWARGDNNSILSKMQNIPRAKIVMSIVSSTITYSGHDMAEKIVQYTLNTNHSFYKLSFNDWLYFQ